MSVPAENSESSGRSSAVRSAESFGICWRPTPMAALCLKWFRQRPKWESEAELRQRLPLGKRWVQRPCFDGRGRGESSFAVTPGISMVELEFAVVEFIFFLVEGHTPPPIKMDRFQNKGVAGRAFSKWLNGKGMDDGKQEQMRRET